MIRTFPYYWVCSPRENILVMILIMVMMVNGDHSIPSLCSSYIGKSFLTLIVLLLLLTYLIPSDIVFFHCPYFQTNFMACRCHICDGIIVKFLFMYVSNICCQTLLCLKMLKIKVHDTRNMGNECRSQQVICCDILSSWGIPESIAIAVDVDVDTY